MGGSDSVMLLSGECLSEKRQGCREISTKVLESMKKQNAVLRSFLPEKTKNPR